MKVVRSLDVLKQSIPVLDDGPASLSLCFIPDTLDVHGLFTIRNAVRICDVAVVVMLSGVFQKEWRQLLEDGLVDLVYVPEEIPEQLVHVMHGERDETFLMQCIVSLVPDVVTVSPLYTGLHSALNAIHKTFPDWFELMDSETPVHILPERYQKVRHILQTAQEIVDDGEREKDVMIEMLSNAFFKNNYDIKKIGVISQFKHEELVTSVRDGDYVVATVSDNVSTIYDILSIYVK